MAKVPLEYAPRLSRRELEEVAENLRMEIRQIAEGSGEVTLEEDDIGFLETCLRGILELLYRRRLSGPREPGPVCPKCFGTGSQRGPHRIQ